MTSRFTSTPAVIAPAGHMHAVPARIPIFAHQKRNYRREHLVTKAVESATLLPAIPDTSRSELKAQLLDSLFGTDRGLRASSELRAELNEIITQASIHFSILPLAEHPQQEPWPPTPSSMASCPEQISSLLHYSVLFALLRKMTWDVVPALSGTKGGTHSIATRKRGCKCLCWSVCAEKLCIWAWGDSWKPKTPTRPWRRPAQSLMDSGSWFTPPTQSWLLYWL